MPNEIQELSCVVSREYLKWNQLQPHLTYWLILLQILMSHH